MFISPSRYREGVEQKGNLAVLIRKIEVFMRRNQMAATTFGRLATSDPRFVLDLRNGRMPRTHTERRVEHFMNTFAGETHAL